MPAVPAAEKLQKGEQDRFRRSKLWRSFLKPHYLHKWGTHSGGRVPGRGRSCMCEGPGAERNRLSLKNRKRVHETGA